MFSVEGSFTLAKSMMIQRLSKNIFKSIVYVFYACTYTYIQKPKNYCTNAFDKRFSLFSFFAFFFVNKKKHFSLILHSFADSLSVTLNILCVRDGYLLTTERYGVTLSLSCIVLYFTVHRYVWHLDNISIVESLFIIAVFISARLFSVWHYSFLHLYLSYCYIVNIVEHSLLNNQLI